MKDRASHARLICRKISIKIGEFAPRGLGHWEVTWMLVEEPSDRFLDALDGWVEEDTTSRRDAVEITTAALLSAWRDAATRFEGNLERELAGV